MARGARDCEIPRLAVGPGASVQGGSKYKDTRKEPRQAVRQNHRLSSCIVLGRPATTTELRAPLSQTIETEITDHTPSLYVAERPGGIWVSLASGCAARRAHRPSASRFARRAITTAWFCIGRHHRPMPGGPFCPSWSAGTDRLSLSWRRACWSTCGHNVYVSAVGCPGSREQSRDEPGN